MRITCYLKKISTFLLGLVAAFLFSILASYVLHLDSINDNLQYLWAIVSIFAYIVFIIVIVSIWNSKLRQQKISSITIYNLALLLLAIVFMLCVYWGIYELYGSSSHYKTLSIKTMIYMFVFYVIFAPIVEETICRGWFLSLFLKHSSDTAINSVYVVTNCMISSLISTILHGVTDITSLLPIFINGVIAAILYIKSRTLILPIIFHTVINTLAWISLIQIT
ncbi:hypothetical protein BU619_08090 [Staphylococcus capitis]|nr:hypothetical protein BU619_08090 [Staphylococcus capitis]